MRTRPIAVPALLLLALTAPARADEPTKPRAEGVFSEAEGDRTIVYIAPEGSRVAKGQVVCVLDAGPASEELKHQKITAAQAEASYQQAKLTREVAETAVAEYEQGAFKQSLETIDGNIALAQAELKRAEDRYERSRRMGERGLLPVYPKTSDKFEFDKARLILEQARTSKDVLLKFTKEKTLKELKAEVEKARADELAKKAAWEAVRAKLKRIEEQTRAQVILAPIDGMVRLARPTGLVEVGAEVCRDQLLLRVTPPGR